MKNSMKTGVATLLLFFAVTLHSTAQTTAGRAASDGSGIRLSAGVETGTPVGSLRNGYGWNLGGSVQADLPIISNALYVTLNSGFNNFFAKNSNDQHDLQLIPVKAGLKYFPLEWFYVQGEAGASFLTNKNRIGGDKSAAFVYAPQAGVLLNTGGKSFIDAGFRFEGNTKFYDGGKTNNFLALRLAYAFSL